MKKAWHKRFSWLLLAVGMVLGAVILFAIRFANVKSDAVHYHANFALYVNGVRDEFKGPGYYEEVQACSADNKNDPKARVHMHNQESALVHVHDNAVTWSDFFANLGYTLGDSVLVTNQGTYVSGNDGKLTFTLNGHEFQNVADKVIGNEDVLLINFGNQASTELKKEYDSIPRTAHKENQEKDPASCGGASTTLTPSARLKKALEFTK